MVERKKVTLPALFKKVQDGEPITWLTCYDFSTAYHMDQAGMDMLLVGDSLGMTMLGYDSTLPVTMDDMIRATQAVRRGAPNVFLVGDMPYMSYQPSAELAVHNAGRFMAETACDAIKLEGGGEMAGRIAAIVAAGIPAIGHIGLTPQSASAQGGFRLQGKTAAHAKKIIDDAKRLEEAGAFAILLELIPDRVCRIITERAEDCIILSLGSGPHAHGQLLISHDALGLYPKFRPRMARVFVEAGQLIRSGVEQYINEVHSKTFPAPENYFKMQDDEFADLEKLL
jgi:3-methyl-2-oxobutanoate hydroxymethyltransferase